MNPRQKELVQSSFAKVGPIAVQAADLFYDRLFEIDPPLRAMFPQEMKEQKKGEPSDLQRVDGMILQVTPEKDEWGNPTYETIFGPFMDYDQVEDILDADYGEEGSRVYPAASAAA